MQRSLEILDDKVYDTDGNIQTLINETKSMQTQKQKQKHKQSTCKQRQPPEQRWTVQMNMRKKNTHSQTLAHTFTLCLCGLGEPAKLSFLLLSEVSQRDPLVLPTCSSHSQTAEEAVSQYTAEQERE